MSGDFEVHAVGTGNRLREWQATVERSQARVAEIELGLTGADADIWRDLARRRIRALEEDRMDYGLMPYEEAELARLKELIGERAEGGVLLPGLAAILLCTSLLVIASFASPA